MPKAYTRKYQQRVDDLYNVLLVCDDLNGAITEERRSELLDWLWSQMKHKHKEHDFGHGVVPPHLQAEVWIAVPRDLLLIHVYAQLLAVNAKEKAPAETAKAFLMKEFRLKREALDKALYRAVKKHGKPRLIARNEDIDNHDSQIDASQIDDSLIHSDRWTLVGERFS
jgi:hypothetical protein